MGTWNESNWKARFFTIWGGQAVSLFGSRLVQFALIWWLTRQTGSATVLAIASLVGLLPQVILGPFVGTLVDRGRRRWIMVLADGVIALATLLLAVLFALGVAEVWSIYVLLFVRAIGGAFHWPAMSASTALMVPKEHLTRVQGFNQMLQGGLGILSAPLGALLVEVMTTQGILAIDVVTALFAIVPLFFIAIPETARQTGAQDIDEKIPFWQDFRAGLDYVRAWPGLIMLMLIAMIINFVLNPAAALEPLLVTEHFGGGALELGWLEAAFGIGILVGGIGLSVWGGFKKRIHTVLVGLCGLGIFFAVLGLLPANGFWYAVAAAFAAAITIPIINGPVHAIVQAAVEPEMQGRVFTLLGSLASAMAPLGLLIAGPVADAIGVQSWFVIGGVSAGLLGIGGFFIPALLNVEENQGQAVHQEHDPEVRIEESLAA
jgi:DHA3 family macrolide efflux protein-like MFS transporter